jgi:hypothetical protein
MNGDVLHFLARWNSKGRVIIFSPGIFFVLYILAL